jgi:sensor domain CHASE-containing protein
MGGIMGVSAIIIIGIIFFILDAIVSLCKIFICKIKFLVKINTIEEKMNQKKHNNIEECFYDIIPMLCRKATILELWDDEHIRDTNYRLISFDYTEKILYKMDEMFSNSNYDFVTFIEDKRKIGYRKYKRIDEELKEEKVFQLKEIIREGRK